MAGAVLEFFSKEKSSFEREFDATRRRMRELLASHDAREGTVLIEVPDPKLADINRGEQFAMG